MIQSFADASAQDFYWTGRQPRGGWQAAAAVVARKLDYLNRAASLSDLLAPPGNRLEALKGDRNGQHSIRINSQWRICFKWTDAGPSAVEIVDYH